MLWRHSGEKLTSFSSDELLTESFPIVCQRYYKCNGEKLTELMTIFIGLKSAVDDRYLGAAAAAAAVELYASIKFCKR
jgi:hypothetical protein